MKMDRFEMSVEDTFHFEDGTVVFVGPVEPESIPIYKVLWV
jgi:hypothetical protein